jgi:RNA polymerase sigma-70 factor (ECF subfamily)
MTSGENFFQGDDEDRTIAAQIVSGQKELFRLLIKKYERPVYGMGMSFFHNLEDASDFTQDVLLKTFRNLSRFEGRSRFSTWLYKIAYNTAINSVKEKRIITAL